MLTAPAVNLVLLLGGLAPGDSAPLKWKLKQGDTFYVKSVSTVQQTLTRGKRATKQKINSTMVVRFTVRKHGPGSTVIDQTILQMTSNADGAGDLADKVKDVTMTVTLNSRGEPIDFKGYEKFVEK